MADINPEPGLLQAHRDGGLARAVERARGMLESCSLCPRRCGVNRLRDERGFCNSGREIEVSSYAPHFGEERPLVGRGGSGTIFLTHCNLGCLFCQNWSISHGAEGSPVTPERLAGMMLELQSKGCHNINFVSPTHFVPQILEALVPAAAGGLHIPLIYNTGGYDSPETLALLEGIFDIYMPDTKFVDGETAETYAQAPDYPRVIKAALREMHRQVGDLVIDRSGIARRGLLVRHLVLPDDLAGTERTMRFLAEEISPATYVNVMAQYHPRGRIPPGSPLARQISSTEYERALTATRAAGLTRLD